jgi:hypothetical protein
MKEVRNVLQKPPKKPLHFVDLKHDQRVPYVRRVGELPIRTVNVLVYKPLIREPETFQNTKYLLYRYATRLLLERVSWLVREHRRPNEGDGFANVIFSNRSNTKYMVRVAKIKGTLRLDGWEDHEANWMCTERRRKSFACSQMNPLDGGVRGF